MSYTANPAAITDAGNSVTAAVEGTSGLHPEDRLDSITSSMPGSVSSGRVADLRTLWQDTLTTWRTDGEIYAQSLRDSATTVDVVDTHSGVQLASYGSRGTAPEPV